MLSKLKKLASRKAKRQGPPGIQPTAPIASTAPITPAALPPPETPSSSSSAAPSTSAPSTSTTTTTTTAPKEPDKPVEHVKTKQEQAEKISAADRERYERSEEATKKALTTIYTTFYSGGEKVSPEERSKKIYSLMSKSSTGYLTNGLTDEEFRNFYYELENSTVTSQRINNYKRNLTEYEAYPKRAAEYQKYKEQRRKYDAYQDKLSDFQRNFTGKGQAPAEVMEPEYMKEPKKPEKPVNPGDPMEVAKKGDYFHVENQNYQESTDDALPGNARRIIVNVKTQQAGLDIARGLSSLYKDSAVSPYFRKYKIYLARNPSPNRRLKYDKIVVYYMFRPDADSGPDDVGNRIVSAITNSVSSDSFDTTLGPFYTPINSAGLAWAEESKYYIKSLGESFTEKRSGIVAKVIEDNPDIPNVDSFITLVNAALDRAGVNSDFPHRHTTYDRAARRLTPQLVPMAPSNVPAASSGSESSSPPGPSSRPAGDASAV